MIAIINNVLHVLESMSWRSIKVILITLIALWSALMTMLLKSVSFDRALYNYIFNTMEYVLDETLSNVELIPPFPIDVVYTWAGEIDINNLSDSYLKNKLDLMKTRKHTIMPHLRYNNELKYSIRSIYKFMPWIRKVFIVVNDESTCPSWINYTKTEEYNAYTDSLFGMKDANYPKYLQDFKNIKIKNRMIGLKCLKASEIFNNKAFGSQTHSGQSFELRLHHIDRLSEHYIYFNDDFFIFNRISYLVFFNETGFPRYPSIYWNKYTKDASVGKIYNDQEKRHNDIKFDVPYRLNSKQLFYDHMPRAFIRSRWSKLEKKYFEWFNFTEKASMHGNFCPMGNRVGCFHGTPFKIMLGYRALSLKHLNQSNKLVSDAQKDLGDFLLDFETEIYDFKLNQRHLHIWVTGNKQKYNTSKKLDVLLDHIERTKPITFNMNDVWHNNLSIYNMQKKKLLKFFEKNFEDVGKIEN